MVRTVAVLPRGWSLSFQVKPFGKVSGWSNILHATIGGNIRNYGDRTPGIWFHSKSTKLHICSAVNGNINYCYNSPFSLHLFKYTTITIRQVQKSNYGNHYFYQIIVNGKKVVDVLNRVTKVFKNVKYYASDPWYHASRANIRHFRISFFNHKGKFSRFHAIYRRKLYFQKCILVIPTLLILNSKFNFKNFFFWKF